MQLKKLTAAEGSKTRFFIGKAKKYDARVCGTVRRLFYSMFEGGFEIFELELVTRFLQTFGFNACTIQEQRIAHLTKNKIHRELRKRQKSRTIQNLTECLREFLVCNRIRTR